MATSLNIQLPAPLLFFVEARIESGEYGSASDYVSELIAHEQESFLASADIQLEAYKQKLRLALQNEEGALDLTAEQVQQGGIVALIHRHLHPAL